MTDLFKRSGHLANEIGQAPPAGEGHIAIDPVCGMKVDMHAGRPVFEHDGKVYYFCREGCRSKFAADPEHYLGEGRNARRRQLASAPKAKRLYTCPMHPEIIREAPGSCPICGMALEPMGVPDANAGPEPELIDFLHRLKLGLVFTVPLFILAMAPHVGFPLHDWIGARTEQASSCSWRCPSSSGAPGRSSSAGSRHSATTARICGRC